ncbi:MAG: tryptophan 7-halogenase [Sphaerospermopsis kisseleviana]
MKLAIIGGGTAGYMAAAHITKHFPNFEIYHIYDSAIPTIGVGEGTQAHFPAWIEDITGLGFSELQEKCNVTRKYGIKFENWGTKNKEFMHNFYPPKSSYGYHISSAKLVELLQEYIISTRIDQKVINVESNGVKVKIEFADHSHLEVDFAFDGRGFPKTFDEKQAKWSLIPTNAALIRRGPIVDYNQATRSIARPHGWIFVIPLTTHTSYGYIYNNQINSVSEIEADFQDFLQSEDVKTMGEDKHLNFPNFACKDFFDGALFKIGNTASFIEPLEATALGVIHAQITYASLYPLQELAALNGQPRGAFEINKIQAFNKFLSNTILKIVLFVGWHYVGGSPFDTEFWRFAKSNFEQELAKIDNPYVISEFNKFLKAGCNFNYWMYFDNPRSSFSGITPASFYEIGNGIGYFAA